ncbi:hypothetical protein TEA_018567 [Camellia sinensis var. sinensis]|uniref:TIP41-like protein n=1 Tax=Camellia sinensis var. sinensis TaxID=542762 RepID=A0A4S4ESI4_CAMSN|nr:hypothetical protein TEA_018567 [Camellia sinensis var. sinensis]
MYGGFNPLLQTKAQERRKAYEDKTLCDRHRRENKQTSLSSYKLARRKKTVVVVVVVVGVEAEENDGGRIFRRRSEPENMEYELEETELCSDGVELRRGLRMHGWEIVSLKRPILESLHLQQYTLSLYIYILAFLLDLYCMIKESSPMRKRNGISVRIIVMIEEWEHKLQSSHLPEMVFGDSSLVLKHVNSGTKIYFNAFDALTGWKQEALPPVQVPAAANWKFRSKSFQLVMLDYDYTFTTPYCGSETVEINAKLGREATSKEGNCSLHWEECKEELDMVALAPIESILFYDEVTLYEDELADNGVSLLTVKVRVMPSSWYLLLRFWLRVDGVLMRLRDMRMHCIFAKSTNPIILREICWREATFQELSAKGYPSDSVAYIDPCIISERLPVIMHKTQKLKIPGNLKQKRALARNWDVTRMQ